MDEPIPKLKDLLGQQNFDDIAVEESPDILNSKDIYCDCKTLILRSKHAKLVLPNEHMVRIQDELKRYQPGDRLFKDIIRGCYWLVDDMYKFEQMGYTKEINDRNMSPSNNTEILTGLRYLACAECNLCPLGWFDPKTKENYLHVWPNIDVAPKRDS